MSPKLAVNSKHNNRMLVKHIRHPSRKKCSLCLPWWHRQGQDPAEPLGFPGGLQRDEATSSQAAWRATYLTFQSLNGLWNGNKNHILCSASGLQVNAWHWAWHIVGAQERAAAAALKGGGWPVVGWERGSCWAPTPWAASRAVSDHRERLALIPN